MTANPMNCPSCGFSRLNGKCKCSQKKGKTIKIVIPPTGRKKRRGK